MSTLSLRLPESLHRKLSEIALQEGISINQMIASAVAEKLAALMTEEYLQTRGKRASRSKFLAVLAKVPDVESEVADRPARRTGSGRSSGAMSAAKRPAEKPTKRPAQRPAQRPAKRATSRVAGSRTRTRARTQAP